MNNTVARPETDLTTSPVMSERIADAYYETTAKRGHSATAEYYVSCANGLRRRFERWVPTNKDVRCLDLACGCGELLFMLEMLGLKNTVGVDLCEDELAQARKHVQGTVCQADVLDYLRKVESESFDFITAVNFLEHVSKDKLLAVLQECRRVLRPGGSLVAMVPNAVSPFGSLTRHWDITHEWAFTTNNFRQLASLTGFDDRIEFAECGPNVHGVISAARYCLWQMIRSGIALWFLVELGTTKDRIYTMDMLVRMRVPVVES